jgi:amino acid adenylation domain-containing protein
MGELSKRLRSLSPQKRALLARRLPPASFAQQRMWFLDSLQLTSDYYTVSAGLRLQGVLDRRALECAFSEIVRRHEVLRSNFTMVEGSVVQCVNAAESFAVVFIDLQETPHQQRIVEAKRLSKEISRVPFNLEDDCLIRVQLMKVDETDHVLVVAMHHIVSDAWSVGLMIQELTTLYEAYHRGGESPLPKLPAQYADYARWQQKWARGTQCDAEIDYWSDKLKDAPPALLLPADHSISGERTFRGGHGSVLLPQSTVEGLEALARRHNVTEFMLLLAAFSVLLWRYSGQSDICVGTPVAGRTFSETEKLIGLFVNTLVMRTELRGNPRFTDLLQQVKEVSLEAFAHQAVPFERLVEILQPERNLSRSPLFQVMFVVQNSPSPELAFGNLDISAWEFVSDVSQFDLMLMVVKTAQGVYLTYEYSADLFEASTMQQMFRNFEVLLNEIVVAPHKKIRELQLLTATEREQLLQNCKGEARAGVSQRSIPDLFQDQVRRTPDALAMEHQGRRLTYLEANWRANQVCHYLKRLEVGPEDLVGVCLRRSLEMVTALLGIMKTGAAYVPIDPEYPEERLQYILADSRIRVLLTQRSVAEKIPGYSGRVVCLDEVGETIAQERKVDPESQTSPERMAYVIYTSGSTGVPKGVVVQHGSLSNLVQWHLGRCSISSHDRVSQLASVAFDAALYELWPPLLVGGQLVLGNEAEPEWLQWITDQRVTVAFLVTPLAEMALAAPEFKRTSLRVVCTGGDTLKRRPPRDLPLLTLNYYGPTEATCVSTSDIVDPAEEAIQDLPPIGQAITNTAAYVLDSEMEPVPAGVAGELFIGGDGLARGYLNRPDLTADRFVPDPFSNRPGERLYRTGDAARYRQNGKLEFLGRLDRQVKIHGFRIELAEIEAALLQQPGVRQASVIVHDRYGDKSLLACVVPEEAEAEPLKAVQLREGVKRRLPAYMVPATVLIRESLPLTANGKLDTKLLANLAEKEIQSEVYVAPRTETEHKLASIWQELLKRERIGVQDNFFQLGGHSLLASRAISRMHEMFGKELQVRAIFEAPTIEELADMIDQRHTQPKEMEFISPLAEKAPEVLLPQVEKFTDAEVERLLDQVLAEGE